jgi:hypothetical protein
MVMFSEKLPGPACSFWVYVEMELSWFLLILSLMCMIQVYIYKRECNNNNNNICVYIWFVSEVLSSSSVFSFKFSSFLKPVTN